MNRVQDATAPSADVAADVAADADVTVDVWADGADQVGIASNPRGAGDIDSTFAAAYGELFAAAYRVAYRILGERADAEDVTQEALTRAYLRWRKVESYAPAWVSRVAANLAIDTWRRGRRSEPHPADSEHTAASAEVGRRAAGPSAATDDEHIGAITRIDLLRLLDTLPRRQRQVLIVRYLADQTEAATAAALGCSVGSVKRHSHRALAALRGLPDQQTQR